MPEPESFHESETVCCCTATPTPVRVWLAAFPALLTYDSAALAAPEDCGVKVSVIGTLCPAGIVTGNEIPVNENSAFDTLAEETVTVAPLALRLAVCLELVP